jgi:dolichyl-phosphate beta-glucosyltransferase
MQEVCVVVPCFNEEHRLPRQEMLAFLHEHENTAICFVDDGSSDGTWSLVERLQRAAPDAVLMLHLSENQGKAEAVRQGVLHAALSQRFRLIGFWDADLSTPLGELSPMLDVLERDPGCELAMGSRVRRLGSRIDRSPLRHYLGRLFSTAASLLLHLPVYDSQCGAKVMRADLAALVFAERFLTKWTFDVEILARLRNLLGPERVLTAVTEVPLRVWTEVGGSKLRMTHMARVPLELLRISRHYNAIATQTVAAPVPMAAVRVLRTLTSLPPDTAAPADRQAVPDPNVDTVLAPGHPTRVS